ncbi:hypothetical protein ACFQZZ_04415 [Nocardia sp. GCM10030253]|uniref:hypothetical protein n=1 Tax=Nocardia sp. GCM10030253 TaxID=3273404 RepID=UPI003636FB98
MTRESTDSARPPIRRWATLVAAGAVLAAAGAATQPFSWVATTLVLVPAAVVLILTIRPTPSRIPRTARLRRGTAVWSVLLVAVSAWEAYAFVRQPDWTRPSAAHPTLSTLLDPALEQWPLRFAGWLVWLGVGWWLVSR